MKRLIATKQQVYEVQHKRIRIDAERSRVCGEKVQSTTARVQISVLSYCVQTCECVLRKKIIDTQRVAQQKEKERKKKKENSERRKHSIGKR